MIFYASRRHFALVIGLIILPLAVYAQLSSKPTLINDFNTTTRPGKIVTADEVELKGTISFNQNEGIVTINTINETKSFTAKRLISFEINEPGGQNRLFYSLPYQDSDGRLYQPEFFEVLAEFADFAVVARQGRLESYSSVEVTSYAASKSVTFYRSEVIYFVSKEGQFFPYASSGETENSNDLYSWRRKGSGYIEKDVLKNFTGEYYPSLRDYAKRNGLIFKDKEDLRTILKEYKRLSGS